MDDQTNFTIQVDYLGNGEKGELDVYPAQDSYLITLDGVELTTISYEPDKIPSWIQIEGNFDQETISRIGEAIENRI